jgi:alpha-L-rhamnosidase
MGATTVWERWDSMLPDGTINPGQMTSFNHYALGAVADWMHRTVGGLSPLEPGYARVLVAPRPGGGLTHATTSLDSPHGRVTIAWRLEGGRLSVDTTLPDGVTGVLRLPGQADLEISGHSTREVDHA